jgi:hypothetical protein
MLIYLTSTRQSIPKSNKNDAHSDIPRCFPVVPKLACHHFDLPITNQLKTITLLGGLTSFGGAGNNYSMHVRSSSSSFIYFI